jgi:GTP-binding protein EngB required for normal cell division
MAIAPKISDTERNIVSTGSETTTEGTPGRLRDYETIKFELAGLIREAGSAAWLGKRETLQNDFRDLLRRLAEDRFYLTLAGQFSRGKSTLMNAMLGMDRLPTGVVPVTSVITAVSYNTRERVVMHFADSNLTLDVPLGELREWITEQGNPGNVRKIEMAEVQLPAELLRRGAFFVDTPGLGSAVLENTATTHRFLPQIDALVLVTSFEFPLSQEEILFLRKARALGRKSFIAINKMDLCSRVQRDEVLEFIQLRLAEEGYAEDVPLFALSAAEALTARVEGSIERLERSGLPGFERALVDYLLNERHNDFLAATCQRIESLLATDDVPGLKELGPRLEEIRGRIVTQERGEPSARHLPQVETGRSVRISSCFVCQQMADATFRFMSQFQYDLSHSRDEQLFHASRSGFCTLHTREYARLASPQGIASGYPRTLLFVAEHLRRLWQGGHLRDDWKDEFERFLPDYRKCRACQAVAEMENVMINDFVRGWQDVGQDRPTEPPCVCLRHLYGILLQTTASEMANRLLVHSAVVLERTAENMERFALRHGGLHLELTTEEEWSSPEKGLNLLVGQPNVRAGGSS